MAVTAAASAPAQTPVARLRQLGADALYLLTGLITSIVAFTVWVTGVSLSLSLGLLIVGFPVVIASFWCFRLLADLERKRAALGFGLPFVSAYRTAPAGARFGHRLKVAAHDSQRWKVVKRFKPARDGSFRVRLKAPDDGEAAVYRMTTRVKLYEWFRKTYPTFTLPRYVDLG